jgi:enamine deaminase RidA (YjgF/YER057c/UK114 family)
MTLQRHHVGKRLTDMVVHNDTIYLAGQVADDTSKDVTGQTEEILGHIARLLHEVGSEKSKLISVQIFLPNMADYDAMNAVWDKWVIQGHTPARATIEAKLASPKYKVEIMAIAAL